MVRIYLITGPVPRNSWTSLSELFALHHNILLLRRNSQWLMVCFRTDPRKSGTPVTSLPAVVRKKKVGLEALMRWFWLESELVFMLSSDSLRKQNKTTKFFTFHKSFKITLQAETRNRFFQVPQNILWNKTRGFTLGKEINPSKHRASLPNFHRSYFNYFLLLHVLTTL